jgi:thiol-disulfide isomerase/thioredoxin
MALRSAVVIVLVAAIGIAFAVLWHDRDAKETPSAPPIRGAVAKFSLSAEGKPAPATTFEARDGGKLALSAFHGRIVLVNFWATWCAPCVAEMPALARLTRIVPPEALALVALSQDLQGWEAIDPFVARVGLRDLPIYLDRDGQIAVAAGVGDLPTTILYGRDGREIGRLTGAAEWDSDEAVALLGHFIEPGTKR